MTGDDWSEVKPATEETQKIADQVRFRVDRRYKDLVKMYKAVEFEEQDVSGTNYRIKVQINDATFVTVKAHKSQVNGKVSFAGFMRRRNNNNHHN